jgi:hypothetical protein
VHPTSGSRRDLRAFFWLQVFSTSQTLSTPTHLRVTQTVGQPVLHNMVSYLKFKFRLRDSVRVLKNKFILLVSQIFLAVVFVGVHLFSIITFIWSKVEYPSKKANAK